MKSKKSSKRKAGHKQRLSTGDMFFALGIIDFMRENLMRMIDVRLAREEYKAAEVKAWEKKMKAGVKHGQPKMRKPEDVWEIKKVQP